jgi:putative membrane protein
MKKVLIAVLAPALLTAPVVLAQSAEEKAPSAPATRAAYTAAEFIEKAGSAGMFEVLSSDLALKRAADPQIKEFAKRMVVDHRASNDKLNSTVQSAQLPPPPTGIYPVQQEVMDQLSTASGREFDRAYVDAQVKTHKEAVELFSTYANEGDNAGLKTFAQQTLPTLADHFKHVKTLEGASPASTGGSK